MLRPPSAPTGASSLLRWANDLYIYLLNRDQQQPTAVKLARLAPGDKAAQDGVLMWDAVNEKVVVSHNGLWKPLEYSP